MRTLFFACPRTGRQVDSGLQADKDALDFARLLDVPLRCPHCRERHVFKAESGELSWAA